MKKLCLMACIMALASTSFANINTLDVYKQEGYVSESGQGLKLPIPDDIMGRFEYAYGGQSEEEQGSVFEWIPKGEDIDNWSELIQIQQFKLPQEITAKGFAEFFLQSLKEQFPTIQSSVLNDANDRYILEWKLPQESNGQEAQNEIDLILTTKNGLYRAAYTKKVPNLTDSERQTWVQVFKNAELVQ